MTDTAQASALTIDLQRLSRLAGVVAGPCFLVISLVGVVANDAFDPFRHAFSFLSLGSLGLLQQANFIVTGCLFAFASVAVAGTVEGQTGQWARVLLLLLGAGKVVAGIFVIDPALGFPAGAGDGPAANPSLSSSLHGIGFMVAMLAWLVLLVLLARRFAREGRGRWAVATSCVAIALLLVPQLLQGWNYGTVYLYLVLTVAYTSLLTGLVTGSWARGRTAVTPDSSVVNSLAPHPAAEPQ
jgi:hypothetical protein